MHLNVPLFSGSKATISKDLIREDLFRHSSRRTRNYIMVVVFLVLDDISSSTERQARINALEEEEQALHALNLQDDSRPFCKLALFLYRPREFNFKNKRPLSAIPRSLCGVECSVNIVCVVALGLPVFQWLLITRVTT
ncbi:unnamed protein product [Schistosoma intercalatum]|nr:unnamed protein product [Schistosoma intercalatum]